MATTTFIDANINMTIPIKVGSTTYQAPKDLLMSCITIVNLIEDMNIEPDQVIFIPTQQNQEYSIKDLNQFFMLFEFSQRNDYTHEIFQTYAKSFNLTQHDMNKYLILINFLDNSQFQLALCNFYAYMIFTDNFVIP